MFLLSDIMQSNASKIHLQSDVAPHSDVLFRSAQHDSRLVAPGDLYIALKGERVDGHTFIPAAAQAGAIGALCNQAVTDVPPDFLQFVVPNVGEALVALARMRASRQKNTTIVAITGTNGKTITKDAIAAVLESSAPTLKTYASYNNEIGLPLTLLRLEEQHRYAVLEMGAEWVGELRWLCSIVQPHWSVVTNVGSTHLKTFGSPEGVAQAKGELVEALDSNGIAILNYDDPIVRTMQQRTVARVLYYGLQDGAEVQATEIDGDPLYGQSFLLKYQDRRVRIQLQLPGRHSISAALAAASIGFLSGVSDEAIQKALSSLHAGQGRGEVKVGPNGSKLIDDSFKANRQSILVGIDMMYQTRLAPEGRRWAILGDMLDLAQYSVDEHYATGKFLGGKVDYLVAIGDQARYYIEGALEAGLPREHCYYFEADPGNPVQLDAAKQSAAALLLKNVQSNDILLLKASHPLSLHTMIESFSTRKD